MVKGVDGTELVTVMQSTTYFFPPQGARVREIDTAGFAGLFAFLDSCLIFCLSPSPLPPNPCMYLVTFCLCSVLLQCSGPFREALEGGRSDHTL